MPPVFRETTIAGQRLAAAADLAFRDPENLAKFDEVSARHRAERAAKQAAVAPGVGSRTVTQVLERYRGAEPLLDL